MQGAGEASTSGSHICQSLQPEAHACPKRLSPQVLRQCPVSVLLCIPGTFPGLNATALAALAITVQLYVPPPPAGKGTGRTTCLTFHIGKQQLTLTR